MKVLKLSESLNHKIETVWEVISDVSRTDWVPGVDEISLNGDIREFFMEGMGKIKEKILLLQIQKPVFLVFLQLFRNDATFPPLFSFLVFEDSIILKVDSENSNFHDYFC